MFSADAGSSELGSEMSGVSAAFRGPGEKETFGANRSGAPAADTDPGAPGTATDLGTMRTAENPADGHRSEKTRISRSVLMYLNNIGVFRIRPRP